MGIKQFSGSLSDFNQAQLDQIDTNAADIKTSVDTIKNTDLSKVNDKLGTNNDANGIQLSSIFDLLKVIRDKPSGDYLNKVKKVYEVIGVASGTTVINVTGKGILVSIYHAVNTTSVVNIRQNISIDGTAIGGSYYASATNTTGVETVYMYRFESSLSIQVLDSAASGENILIAYLLDN
jgi:hypothetical protein